MCVCLCVCVCVCMCVCRELRMVSGCWKNLLSALDVVTYGGTFWCTRLHSNFLRTIREVCL